MTKVEYPDKTMHLYHTREEAREGRRQVWESTEWMEGRIVTSEVMYPFQGCWAFDTFATEGCAF